MVVLHQVFHHQCTLLRAFETFANVGAGGGVSPSIMLSSNISIVKDLLMEIDTNIDLKDRVIAM